MVTLPLFKNCCLGQRAKTGVLFIQLISPPFSSHCSLGDSMMYWEGERISQKGVGSHCNKIFVNINFSLADNLWPIQYLKFL